MLSGSGAAAGGHTGRRREVGPVGCGARHTASSDARPDTPPGSALRSHVLRRSMYATARATLDRRAPSGSPPDAHSPRRTTAAGRPGPTSSRPASLASRRAPLPRGALSPGATTGPCGGHRRRWPRLQRSSAQAATGGHGGAARGRGPLAVARSRGFGRRRLAEGCVDARIARLRATALAGTSSSAAATAALLVGLATLASARHEV